MNEINEKEDKKEIEVEVEEVTETLFDTEEEENKENYEQSVEEFNPRTSMGGFEKKSEPFHFKLKESNTEDKKKEEDKEDEDNEEDEEEEDEEEEEEEEEEEDENEKEESQPLISVNSNKIENTTEKIEKNEESGTVQEIQPHQTMVDVDTLVSDENFNPDPSSSLIPQEKIDEQNEVKDELSSTEENTEVKEINIYENKKLEIIPFSNEEINIINVSLKEKEKEIGMETLNNNQISIEEDKEAKKESENINGNSGNIEEKKQTNLMSNEPTNLSSKINFISSCFNLSSDLDLMVIFKVGDYLPIYGKYKFGMESKNRMIFRKYISQYHREREREINFNPSFVSSPSNLLLNNELKDKVSKKTFSSITQSIHTNCYDNQFVIFESINKYSYVLVAATKNFSLAVYDILDYFTLISSKKMFNDYVSSIKHYPYRSKNKNTDYILTTSWDSSIKLWEYYEIETKTNLKRTLAVVVNITEFMTHVFSACLVVNKSLLYVVYFNEKDNIIVKDMKNSHVKFLGIKSTVRKYTQLQCVQEAKTKKNYIIAASNCLQVFDFSEENKKSLVKTVGEKGRKSKVVSLEIQQENDKIKIFEIDTQGVLRVWDFSTEQLIFSIETSSSVVSMCLWNSSYIILAGYNDSTLKIVSLKEEKIITEIEDEKTNINTIRKLLIPTMGEYLVSISYNNEIRFFCPANTNEEYS